MTDGAPLVRLRVRRLRCIRDDSDQSTSSTIFCPERFRSMDLDTCRRCARFSSTAEGTLECAPLPCERVAHELLVVARLGGDVCVGDAMGPFALTVHADLTGDAVMCALAGEDVVVAIVVDEDGRLVGLMDVAEALPPTGLIRAREVARRVAPIHESALLADAIDRMVHERARALPVVDDGGCVVALLTDLDALRWVARRSRPLE